MSNWTKKRGRSTIQVARLDPFNFSINRILNATFAGNDKMKKINSRTVKIADSCAPHVKMRRTSVIQNKSPSDTNIGMKTRPQPKTK